MTQRTASSQRSRLSSKSTPKGFQFRPSIALAHAEFDAPVTQQVECGHTFCNAGRIIGGELDDAVSETNVFRALAGGTEEHFWRRRVRIFLEEVVLDLPGEIEAEAIRQLELVQSVVMERPLGVGLPGAGDL